MNNLKVSIAVPIYGVELYIERCAISLFEQTYLNIEYIFINDCTKDRSIEILQDVINRYPSRKPFIRIIQHKDNRGLAAARNTAIDMCTGEFVMHIDSDDFIETDAVQLSVEKQRSTGADIISFNACVCYSKYKEYYIHPNYSNPKEMTSLLIARKVPVSIWGRLIRLSLYRDNNVKAEEGTNMGEDYQVMPILAYHAQKVATLNKILYFYECTNINAYTHHFSEKIDIQDWRSFKLLKDYFENKDSCFIDSLKEAELKVITHSLIACSKMNDNKHNLYYNNILLKLNDIDHKYWTKIPFAKRVVFYLKRKNIVFIYVRIASFIKYVTVNI